MSEGPLKRYRDLVDSGAIELDAAQLAAAEKLDALANALARWRPRKGLFSLFSGSSQERPRGFTFMAPSAVERQC